jgi:hypothetical protein
VAQQPDTVVPTEGLAEPDGSGVVPPRQDVVQPVAGVREQQAPIEDPELQGLSDGDVYAKFINDGMSPTEAFNKATAISDARKAAQPTPVEEFEDVPDFVVSYDPAATQKEIDEISEILRDNPRLSERDRAPLEERLDELLGRQTTEEAPVEELNKKSVEETTSLGHIEAQAKIDAAKDQPGEMYTATVTIPEYFDEPAYDKNTEYKVVRGEGGWTVITAKYSDGDEQSYLLPPSRAAALTDEELIKEINDKNELFNSIVTKGKLSGPETPEAVETETQEQEAPTAEPTVEIAPEQQEMYRRCHGWQMVFGNHWRCVSRPLCLRHQSGRE